MMVSFMFLVFAFLVNHILLTPLFWCIAAILFLLGVWGEIEIVLRKHRRYVRKETAKQKSTHHSSSHKTSTHSSHTHTHTRERIMKTADGEDILTLPVSKTEELHYVKIADVQYEGNDYAIMQRARHFKEREIDDAVVFRVTLGENGEKEYAVERNEKIVGAVFMLYRKTLNPHNEK